MWGGCQRTRTSTLPTLGHPHRTGPHGKDDLMNTARRTASLLALVAAGALALAGCATAASPAASGSPTVSEAEPAQVEAGWLDGGRQIALVTWGSSTCVPVASDVALQPDGALAVTLDDGPADRVCTADYAPRATLVGVPEGVDPAKGVDLVITTGQGHRGQATLTGIAGAMAGEATDDAPSAGWVDGDLIAILTWGSSTCAPVVQDAVASTPTTVAVTFATPAENRPCTMDMAPRVALASVGGLGVERAGASVVLSGGDAQFATPVTVPVLG